MAQSLICKDCGTFLRSVKEAQDHAEVSVQKYKITAACFFMTMFLFSVCGSQATNHSNFEESVEAVLKLVCTDCGKVCRNSTESDLHTKRTGHASFQDKTGDAEVINTEVEMAEARAELNIVEEDGESKLDQDLVVAEVDETLLQQLLDMGFERNRAVRAIYNSGGDAADAAVAWLADHEGDADLDEVLMVPKATAKRKLSPEEAKEQAAELMRKAKMKREAEEREAERVRELSRVSGSD